MNSNYGSIQNQRFKIHEAKTAIKKGEDQEEKLKGKIEMRKYQ